MTDDASVLGSLHSVDGEGVVRMEDRLDTGIDDLWGALTDPDRLAHWYGEVEGELSQGGEFRVRIALAGERTGQVEACEPPQRLLLRMRDPDPQPGQPERTVIEARLYCRGRSDQAGLGNPGLAHRTAPGLRRWDPDSRRASGRLHQRSRAPHRRRTLGRALRSLRSTGRQLARPVGCRSDNKN